MLKNEHLENIVFGYNNFWKEIMQENVIWVKEHSRHLKRCSGRNFLSIRQKPPRDSIQTFCGSKQAWKVLNSYMATL